MFRTLKKSVRSVVPVELWESLKSFSNKEYRDARREFKRIDSLDRFYETETLFLNRKLRIVDNRSYLFIRKEIFDLQIYKFNCPKPNPYILDCGANIGLSVIYFKQLFPNAHITAFEPDGKVFDVLRFNMQSFQLSNVTIHRKACWTQETTLQFYSEGADGGRAAAGNDINDLIEVQAVRLKDYLSRHVDFLKIDIEGAETKVLEDCSDVLGNVDKLFVEYHSFVDQPQDLDRLLQVLTTAGFRYQIHHVGVFSSHPFIEVADMNKMDLQLNIFAYRT